MTKTLAHGYSSESTRRELSTWQGSDGFQNYLRHCALDKSSLRIGLCLCIWNISFEYFETNLGMKLKLILYFVKRLRSAMLVERDIGLWILNSQKVYNASWKVYIYYIYIIYIYILYIIYIYIYYIYINIYIYIYILYIYYIYIYYTIYIYIYIYIYIQY